MNTNHGNHLLSSLALLTLGSLGIVVWSVFSGQWPVAAGSGLTGGHRPLTSSVAPADGVEPLPVGASIQSVLPNMDRPTAMAFDPQGRLFYTEKTTGRVRLFENGTLQSSPVITFSTDGGGERGLLGIAIDPAFNANHYIYVYYTCAVGPGCASTENRVARFTESNGVGSNPTTIFFSPQTAGNHNGGNIHFGPDGKLYVSVGDNANAGNSQNATVKNGKIHRINSDGTIPPDNPVFTQTGALRSLYVLGLRNSYDFAFDPLVPGRIFASENGPGCDDEMNRIEAGYNYGWRANYPCDDPNPSPVYNTIPPLWYLGSGACCLAPTGITVYTGSQIPQWQNHLFMASYNNSSLRHFYLDATRTVLTATNVVQGVIAPMDLVTGPDGAFWYMEGGGYTNATLKRIVGAGATNTPVSTLTPTRTSTSTHTPSPEPTCVSAAWNMVFSPNPGAGNNNLHDVQAVSPNDIWAVGSSGPSPSSTLALHWDGAMWTQVPSPNAGTSDNDLQGLTVLSANNIWAVGSYLAGSVAQTLVLHWNGTAWTQVPSPNVAGRSTYLSAVDAVSPADIWAVGWSVEGGMGRSLTMHWDGTQWSIVPSPNPIASNELNGVVAVSANEVYVVGGFSQTLAMRWDGAQWNVISTPDPGIYYNMLYDVTVAPGGDIWAVGYYYLNNTLLTLTLRNWQQVTSPNPGAISLLRAVSAVSANDIWAVGLYQPGIDEQTLIIHWDGSQWNVVPIPFQPGINSPYALTTISSNDAWVVGNYGRPVHHTLTMHYTAGPCVSPTNTPTGTRTFTVTPTRTNPPTGTPSVVRTDTPTTVTTNTPTETPNPSVSGTATRTPTLTPTLCPMSFRDVPAGEWYYEYVRCLYCRGGISGYGDNTFRPYNNTTRGQMTKIVILAFNHTLYIPPVPTFRDVPANDPFYREIETAAHEGIVSGYTCGPNCLEFHPGNNVTRGQLSKIVVKAAGWGTINPGSPTFADVPETNTFYPYVETAYCHAIIAGYTCGGPGEPCPGLYFRPGNNATRAQIAKIVCLGVRNPNPCLQ